MITQAHHHPPSLPAELSSWIEEKTGTRIIRIERVSGGARRQAWAIDVGLAGHPSELFLRYDPPDPAHADDPYTIRREALFYEDLRGSGVRIPHLVACHPRLQAMLVHRVRGSSAYAKIAHEAERREIAYDFMRQLARIHRHDVQALAAVLPDAGHTMRECVAADLVLWEQLYRATGASDALLEYALHWLRAHIPELAARPALVHGDAGQGNFLFAEGKVSAILDWELAHLGDPMEDLAWVSMRSILEPFPDFDGCLHVYEETLGQPIDRARVAYHRVFVQCRIAIIRLRKGEGDLANSLVSRTLHRRLLVLALAEATGVALQRQDFDQVPESRNDHLYATVLKELQDSIAPALGSSHAQARLKSVARIVKYLRSIDRFEGQFQLQNHRDLRALLGGRDLDEADAQAELVALVRDDRLEHAAALRYFARVADRETRLTESALGGLAWRGFPSLCAGAVVHER